MNATQTRMMAQLISNGMYTGYAKANDQRLAPLLGRNSASALGASRTIQEVQGLQPTKALEAVQMRTTKALSFEDSTFLRNYRNDMLDIQTAAARLQKGEGTGENLAAVTTKPAVAEARGRMENADDVYSVVVEQLARGQVDQSAPLAAEDPLPAMGGSIHIQNSKGNFDFFMSGAGLKDNREMLESFAAKLNAVDTGVTASVVETAPEAAENGAEAAASRPAAVALRLESSPGEKGGFNITGSLARRLNIATTQEAGDQEAVYSVEKNGEELGLFTSDANTVEIDGLFSLKLKDTGETQVTAAEDMMEKLAQNLDLLVEKFNSTREFLRQNDGGRMGVRNQLHRMEQAPASERDMSLIGITPKQNGSYAFDREAFLNQARRTPAQVRDIANNFAQRIGEDAQRGLRESSGSLVSRQPQRQGTVEYASRVDAIQKDPVNVLSTYSKDGVKNLMNFYAAGVLLNLNA